jgi:acyl-coenzyme A thioesterase PaaI-like protein
MNNAAAPVPFRLAAERLERASLLFNERGEVRWFGFHGRFEGAAASVAFSEAHRGLAGGGGTEAVNGGVIAAGFDAALVLAGLGHYETDTVVTVELSVQFLALAPVSPGLRWRAWATRTTRSLAFLQGALADLEGGGRVFATANGLVKPA